jgi:single-strand DNA-binding protein
MRFGKTFKKTMINNVVLAGNVVSDPETRSTTSGKTIATVRLAVNNPLNENDSLFIDVDVWEKQAEFVANHVKKGSAISVIGRLKQDSWEKDGQKRSKILVVAERINFVGPKRKDAAANDDDAPAPAPAPVPQQKWSPKTQSKPAAKSSGYSKGNSAPRQQQQDSDEEIPI